METIEVQIILADEVALLYKNHQNSLMTYCLSLTQDLSDAEDLLQEAFLKALTTVKGAFKKGKNFTVWMNSIIHNAFIDDMRVKSKNKKIAHTITQSMLSKPLVILTPEELFMEREFKSLIDGMMKDFTPTLKKIVRLFYFENYKVREIALELNMSEGTIKTMLVRIRKNFTPFLRSVA